MGKLSKKAALILLGLFLALFLFALGFVTYKLVFWEKPSTVKGITKELGKDKFSKQELREYFQAKKAPKVKLKGTVKRIVSDNSKVDVSYLETKDKKYTLYVTGDGVKLKSGSEVAVDAYQSGDNLGIETLEEVAPPRAITGQQDLLIITFNWQNDTSTPFTRAAITDQVYLNADSPKNFFAEASYSQISLNGDISNVTTAYYTIPYDKNAGCSLYPNTDLDHWTDAADDAAQTAGYNFANYDRIAYVFPDNTSCGWDGLGEVGGWRIWLNGTDDHYVFTHELGHNFSAGHSNTLDCGAVTVAAYTSCVATEYADPYDVMGNIGFFHMNAGWKNDAQWINGKTQEATTTGTYTIEDIETSATGYQALQIPHNNDYDYYLFEFRKATGFDAGLGAGVTAGATARIYTDYYSDPYSDTYLLDFTPANGWSDVALTDGATFTDQQHNISVTQVSHTADSVTLNVTFPPPPTYTPVYRFWNNNGTHFYTASESEKNNVIARWPNIYHFEGIAYYVSSANSIPLYRLWNANGTHFYTASLAEAQNAVARWPNIYRLEGIAYNVAASGTPVYRFWNTNGTHFYTASESEKNNVIARWPNIYRLEGIGFYLGS